MSEEEINIIEQYKRILESEPKGTYRDYLDTGLVNIAEKYIDLYNKEKEKREITEELVLKINKRYISKDKIKNIINQLEEEQEQNRKEFSRGIDYLSNEIIESASNKIVINLSIREYLKELLEE